MAYFSVLNARFEGALNVSYTIHEKYFQYKLPVFSLQVIIENIIKHNKISVKQPITVIIATSEINNTLMISNTIIAKSKIEESNKIGLNNIKSRYHLLDTNGFKHYSKNNLFNVELPLIP